jgi:hypothetical protein
MRPHRSLIRKINIRPPNKKFILYTEGKNTEPDYFRAIKRYLSGALIELEIIDAAGVPFTIAEKAGQRAAMRSRRGPGSSSFEVADEIWAVFDRDTHVRVDEALERCRQSKVEVAFSDPCFELWLILHHVDFDKLDDHHQVQAHLKVILCDYDPKKGKTTNCEKLMPLIEAAECRAEKQLARRKEEGARPSAPFTTVFQLTRRMREAHETRKKRKDT